MTSKIMIARFRFYESKYFLIKLTRFLDAAYADDDGTEGDNHRLALFMDIVDSVDCEDTSDQESKSDMLGEEEISE